MINLEEAKEMCGKGWLELIEKVYQNKPIRIDITDIKEKMGWLRIYFSGNEGLSFEDWNKFSDLVSNVEDESMTICEECGENAEIKETKTKWLKCLCDKCMEIRNKNY